MKISIQALLTALLLLSAAVAQVEAQTQPPCVFFSDIITGPNKGGENNNGVYVSIYGKRFGATRGSSSVTIGGGAPAQYKIWGQGNGINTALDMIVVQLGPNAATGNIIVTVNGQASNGLPFTVSTGRIFFASPSGSDSAAGSIAAPWRTPTHARKAMAAGDTVYFRAGIYTSIDDFGSVMLCNGSCSGTATQYQNFLGYPGETAQIGDGTVVRGIYHWAGGVWQYAAFGELTMRGQAEGFTCQNTTTDACNWLRFVGNDFRSTHSQSVGWDMETPGSHIILYGNDSSHNCQGASNCNFDNRAYSVYFGGYGAQSDIDIGWNALHDNAFGKGIQVYGHHVGDSMTNLTIHDNFIFNNAMPGITMGGGDPSSAGGDIVMRNVVVYNNIFYNNAYGSRNSQGQVQMQSYSNRNGDYHFYNNTFYDDGINRGGTVSGKVFEIDGKGVASADFKNNIFYANSQATAYFVPDTFTGADLSGFTGTNNLYFGIGNGTIPSFDAKSIFADPKFTNPSTGDLTLQIGSPAIDAGTNTGLAMDFDGIPRPQGAAFDIGAFEFITGAVTKQPAAPANPHVVAH